MKYVTLLRNCEPALHEDKIQIFMPATLDEKATHKLELPFAARKVFTTEGELITDISNIYNGQMLVISAGEPFKRVPGKKVSLSSSKGAAPRGVPTQCVVSITPDGTILTVNLAFCKQFGHGNELVGKNFSTLLTGPEKEHLQYLMAEVTDHETRTVEMLTGDGNVNFVRITFTTIKPQKSEELTPSNEQSPSTQPSKQHNGNQKDGESQYCVRVLTIEKLDDSSVVIVTNANCTIQSCSRSITKMFGYEPQELVGQNVTVLMPEPYHAQHDSYVKKYLASAGQEGGGKPMRLLERGRNLPGKHKDGTVFPICIQLSSSHVPKSTPQSACGRLPRTTSSNQEQFTAVITDTDDVEAVLVFKELDGVVVQSTSTMLLLLGYTAKDCEGENVARIFPGLDLQTATLDMKETFDGSGESSVDIFPVTAKHKDGSTFDVSMKLMKHAHHVDEKSGHQLLCAVVMRLNAQQKQKYDEKTHVVHVGEYVVENQIAEGGFAVVRHATHSPTGKQVVAKIFEKSKLSEMENSLKLIDNEINIHGELDHPLIPHLLSVQETTTSIYLFMEYAGAHTLHLHVLSSETDHLTEEETKILFTQMVESLQYLHKKHIAHLDIKLHNFVIDIKTRVVKLIDFGVSRHFEYGKVLNVHCGSPLFAAPEMFSDVPYVGPEPDIWSLGVCLSVCLSGNFWMDPTSSITNGEMDDVLPSNVSKECIDLLQKMLLVNPQKRPSIEEVAKHAWLHK